MATAHEKDSLLQLCSRANQLGNTISTRMVQFLSEVKHQPVGFRELGNEFLDICRIMASIEAGLGGFLKSNGGQFPPDVLVELDRKFRQTVEDFLVLNQLLQKFLDYEKGGAVARVQKTWRMVFADKDIAKVRSSLQSNREALKMSMLVFSWSPNYQTLLVAPEQRDLAAKLERPLSVTDTVSSLSSFTPSELEGTTARDGGVAEMDDTTVSIAELDDTEVPVAELDSIAISPPQSEPLRSPKPDDADLAVPTKSDAESTTAPAPQASENDLATTPGDPQEVAAKEEPAAPPSTDTPAGVVDVAIPESAPVATTKPKRLPVVKADPSKMKRSQPNNPQKTNPPSLQKALVSAIQGRKHKIAEQLLNRGVSPNTSPKSALFEATRNEDLPGMALLLEFGADPNFTPDDGKDRTQIPLCYTADRDFADGAGLLLAYGADPDVRTVWNQVPLFLVSTWNRSKTATKLLEYGADPNLAAPEYPLLQAIPHEDCVCLAALLAYGADPTPIRTVLVRAAERNNAAAVDLLVDYGADVNQRMDDYYKWTPLTTAIRHDHHEVVATLLARGADPNRAGEAAPIFVAAGKLEVLKQLVAGGADIHNPPGVAEKAVLSGNLEALEWLLDVQKVDINASVDGVHRPLGAAVRHNNVNATRVLLDRGADPNLKGADYPLFEACYHPECVRLLLAAGVSLTQPEGVLERAAYCGKAEVVEMLIRAGAAVDARPAAAGGSSALTTALRWNHADVARVLLDGGADPNFRGDGFPLEQAVEKPALVEMLLDAGADTKKQGPGLVELAAQRGVLESVKLLVKAGASPEEQREAWGKQRALATAVREGREEIARWLVDEGKADVNSPGEALPLVLAVRRSPNDGAGMVEFLLDKGADVNLQHAGWNAVMEAADRNMVDLVRLFIDRGGVNLDLTDNSGRTALDMAANQGHDDLVGILLEAM